MAELLRRARVRAMERALLACMVVVLTTALSRGARAQVAMIARSETGEAVELPLAEQRARVVVDQQHATTELTHVYRNHTGRRVEGIFTLVAGEGAHVDGFAYWNGEQKIVGEIVESSAARSVYYGTVNQRRDPGLLEKAGEGSFSFRVFPIQPDEQKRVDVRLEQFLSRRGRVVEYRLPLALAGAEVEVSLKDGRGIRRLRSPSHDIDVSGGPERIRLRVGDRRASSGKPCADAGCGAELVLRWELDDGHFQPAALVHRDPGQTGYFVLTLAAPAAAAELHQDVTLVVDGSGGAAEVREAARALVRKLPAADRFNVVLAGSPPVSLFASPRWATKETRGEADALLANGPGATQKVQSGDLGQALRDALAAQEDVPRNRTVVLLTHGTQARSALAAAREDKRDVRIFALAFGDRYDKAALSALTAGKRGRLFVAGSAAARPERLARLAQQIAAPVMVDLSLQAEGVTVSRVYPRTLPDLYQEQEVVVVGRIEPTPGMPAGKGRLFLRGRSGGEPIRLVAPIEMDGAASVKAARVQMRGDSSGPARRPWIGKLWGRARIDHLLEEISLEGGNEQRVSETIDLALTYNVVTPYTAFLAIPESELSSAAAETLASARARKRALLSQHPDALALMQPAGGGDGVPAVTGSARPEPMAMEAYAPPSVHGGGCAGCRTASAPAGSNMAAWLVGLGLAISVARRARSRRRGVRREPSGTCPPPRDSGACGRG